MAATVLFPLVCLDWVKSGIISQGEESLLDAMSGKYATPPLLLLRERITLLCIAGRGITGWKLDGMV